MTKQLPQTLRVGANDYSVELTDTLTAADGFIGMVRYNETKILLQNAGLSEGKRLDVLIHELTHAIMYEAGFEEHEEDTVNRVGKVLTQVLRDNDFTFARGRVDE
ncbi:hypothetical protein [Alteribacter populi]|uniref:hypothetical protein n=1 Tax=Alteribacter populi TaxID=2011011 RepID=UPI000BBA917A|nr:hypothetical protein [Alteribacter populi]